jgi:PAS domain S-box-containing protein
MPYPRSFPYRSAGILLAGGIFLLDRSTPHAVASEVLYAIPVLFGLWTPRARFAVGMAIATTLLSLSDVTAFSTDRQVDWTAWSNVILSLGAIWSATLVVWLQRQTRGALIREQELTRSMLDVVDTIVVALDMQGVVTLVNRRGCEILGLPEAEILGRNWFEHFIPPGQRESLRAVHARVLEEDAGAAPAKYENPILTSDGSERLVAWHNDLLRDRKGRLLGVLSSGQDITDLKRAQLALQQSLKELSDFKYALDASSILAITDAEGTITYANDYFCRISQYRRDELIGRTHRLLNSAHHSREFFRDLWDTIRSGRVWKGEIRNRAKDGSTYWVETTIVPFLDDQGTPYQYLAIRSDISERKRAEQALLEQRALVRLGEMAAVVAHEVKNPLAGIAGALQVLRGRLSSQGADVEIIQAILERLDGLNATVQDLLVFARPVPPRPRVVGIRRMLRDTVEFLARDPQCQGVTVEIPPGDCLVSADPEQTREAFVNVLLNAAQAMNGEGRLQISRRCASRDCHVSISDSGPGVPPELRERVFEPFFTTKHRGTGLGLAIARRVVQAQGGEISLECPPEGGTTVTISLPLAAEPTEPEGE